MKQHDARINRPAERLSRARQRHKLIDACITALHRHGPSRTTIDKVVSIADMSPGIVNFYFETKAALLVAALDHLAVEFETLVLAPLAALRATPIVALGRLIELYLDPEVASARKVSVWYSFWGESSSRREYYTICGKRDLAFAALVQDLVARVICEANLPHLDADAVALGLVGCLEMMWQEIAFQEEADVDRETARARCRAYLRSVFPGQFSSSASMVPAANPDAAFRAELAMFRKSWEFACSIADVPRPGDYVAWQSAIGRTLILHGADGTIRAFPNTCLHRPHTLVAGDDGHLGDTMICPSDGAVYGHDGTRRNGGALAAVSSVTEGSSIFVTQETEFAGKAPDLATAGLVPLGVWRVFDVAADWKLVVEHWVDAYFETSARMFAEHGRSAVERDEGSISRVQVLRGEAAGFSPRLYLAISAACDRPRLSRRLIRPNLFVETRPDGATVRQVLPLTPGRSRVRVRRYGLASTDRTARAMSYLAARMERIWERQDVHAIESTQV